MRVRSLTLAAALCFGTPLAFAETGLAAKDCTSTFRLLMENQYTNLPQFRAIFKHANPAPLSSSHELDNMRFIELAADPSKGKELVYLHLTLKVLKPLNDRVFNDEVGEGKEDVNASRNLFRALFAENVEASPALHKAMRGRFMDFKTVEAGFSPRNYPGGKTQLLRDLDYALRQTNLQFEKAMLKIYGTGSELVKKMSEEHGLVSDFTAWHLAGVAEGDPDLAAFAAREATSKFDRETSFVLKANQFSPQTAADRVAKVETSMRPRLISELGEQSPVFAKDASGKHLILSKDSIDLLRKVSVADLDEYVAAVTGSFKKRLGVSLTKEQVLVLRDYFAEADRFQPSIRAPKRVQIDLSQARHGIVSVDFAGQNVENLYQTMGAVAEAHAGGGDVGRNVIALSRRGEALSTERLARLKQNFTASAKAAGIEGELQFSGDDGVLILKSPLSEAQWTRLKQELAKGADPLSDYRMVNTGPVMKTASEVDTGGISRETVKAEDFEKKLRSELYGYLPRERVGASGISVTLDPTSKRAVVTFPGAWTSAEIAMAKKAMAEKKLAPAGYSVTFPVVAY